ncbi:MAG: hypothetical protein IT558_06215 [Alphaproteobacteria bacterium]|nr:hypothetical protein [Alphaproteobacteria bacterium]
MNRRLLLLMFFCAPFLFLETARACLSVPADKEKMLKEAYFIGIVKILETHKAKPSEDSLEVYPEKKIPLPLGGWESTVQPLDSYVGNNIPEKFSVQSGSDCEIYKAKPGNVIEVIVLKRKEELVFPNQGSQLKKEEWHALRKASAETPALEAEKRKCETIGANWVLPEGGVASCSFPTDDYNKECSDDIQCEGLCIAELNVEEIRAVAKQSTSDLFKPETWSKPVKKNGKCSQWRNMQGCQYIVNNGVVRRECKTF